MHRSTATAFSRPSAAVRGRLAIARKTVFFRRPAKLFSNRDSTGNRRLRIPRIRIPTNAPPENSIQDIFPATALFHRPIRTFPRTAAAARNTAVGAMPAFQFPRKVCANRCQEFLFPFRKPWYTASYSAAKDVPAVTTGKQPSSQNRLRKMQSVIWVTVIISGVSG